MEDWMVCWVKWLSDAIWDTLTLGWTLECTHLTPRKEAMAAPDPMINAGKYHLQY
jgi:hypothetical protein